LLTILPTYIAETNTNRMPTQSRTIIFDIVDQSIKSLRFSSSRRCIVKVISIPIETMIIARDSGPCISGQSNRDARRRMRRKMDMRGQCFSREESIFFGLMVYNQI
jgi:hypothetical protein